MTAVPNWMQPLEKNDINHGAFFSETLANKLAGNTNFLHNLKPGIVGEIQYTSLTAGQFRTLHGTEWVEISQETDITGSEYHSLTGITLTPDFNGVFIKNTVDYEDGFFKENQMTPEHTHNTVFSEYTNTPHAEANTHPNAGPVRTSTPQVLNHDNATSEAGTELENRPVNIVLRAMFKKGNP